MSYVVCVPGSCGEFIQGYCHNHSFMITCPINRYAKAEIHEKGPETDLPPKASAALQATLHYLGKTELDASVSLQSDIPVGKGMASSTADIAAVAQAAALYSGRRLTGQEIASIALSIEPSDATFFKGIVEFDYREGKVIRSLGPCPPMQILIYDCGGKINTILFNARKDLIALQKSNEGKIRKACRLFLEGLENRSLEQIGKASTKSAFLNQKILYKKELKPFCRAGLSLGGKGVICAHSGTVLGLILSPDDPADAIRFQLDRMLDPGIHYLDTVNVTNQGMKILPCREGKK